MTTNTANFTHQKPLIKENNEEQHQGFHRPRICHHLGDHRLDPHQQGLEIMDKIRDAGRFLHRHQEFILGYVAGAFIVPIVTQKIMTARLPVRVSADLEVVPTTEVAA